MRRGPGEWVGAPCAAAHSPTVSPRLYLPRLTHTPYRMPASPDSPYFEVRQSAIQGRGGFAARPIRKGTRIIEYVGEKISQKEADRRYDDASMKRHHTFLFALDSGKVIDAAVGGNDARFINHSCDPNCQAVEEGDRIFIEAIRGIAPGEELYYDYAYERSSATTPEDEALYKCLCGSAKCRGSILAPLKPKKKPAKKAASKAKGKTKTKSKSKSKSTSKTKGTKPSSGTKTKTKAKGKTKTARR